MKKTGFTLAEVLITFGIIGIVAAVTLPGLNNNVNKSKVGPALAKAVNTLEAANKVALLEYDVTSLDAIDADKNYLENISLQLSGHTGLKADKTADKNSFVLKDGTSLTLYSTTQAGPLVMNKTSDEKYNYAYYVLHIDINGSKTPNKKGQDQFMVYVDTAGTVIPAGGVQAQRYFTNSDKWIADAHTARDCKTKRPSEINDYCTGTIMEDGWQIKW